MGEKDGEAQSIIVASSEDNRTGFPHKRFTVSLQDRVVNALGNGSTVATACMHAGIGKRTYYDLLEKDAIFAIRVQEARDFKSNEVLSLLLKMGSPDPETGKGGDWRALAEWLRLTQPYKYGNRATVVENTTSVLNEAEAKRLKDALEIAIPDPVKRQQFLLSTIKDGQAGAPPGRR